MWEEVRRVYIYIICQNVHYGRGNDRIDRRRDTNIYFYILILFKIIRSYFLIYVFLYSIHNYVIYIIYK